MKQIISWIEIPSLNMDRTVAFYNAILGLDMNINDWGEEKMAFLPDDAGAISQSPDFHPSKDGVLVSLNAGNDIDGLIKKIRDSGGTIVREKTKIEAEGRGFFALFLDPEGNRLGLYGN